MGNVAFADELGLAPAVAHVDAHHAGGQRFANPALTGAGELEDRGRAFRLVRIGLPAVAEFVAAPRWHAHRIEEADLLGLGIGDRGAAADRIDVEIAQPLAAAAFGAGHIAARAGAAPAIDRRGLADLPDAARHQQGAGIGKGRAGRIGEGDPALDVDLAGLVIEQRDIVGLPAEARGQVAERQRPGASLGGIDGDAEGRAGAQAGGNRIEDHPHRQAIVAQHLDPVPDLQHHAAIDRQHRGALAGFGAGRGIGAEQGNRLAHRLLHQRFGREQVIVEVLFDYAEAFAAQCHRFGADLGRNVGKFLPRFAGGQVHLPHVLHQRLAIVVDGDRQIALRGAILRKRSGRNGHQSGPRQNQPHAILPRLIQPGA